MSTRPGPYVTLRDAATFAANDTWYESPTTFRMGKQANSVRIFATVAVASAGNVEFYVQHSPDNGGTWYDYCVDGNAPKIWGALVFSGAGSKTLELAGLNLFPIEDIKVFFRASAGAASATVGLKAMSWESNSGSSTGGPSAGDAPSGDPDAGNPVKVGFHARSSQLTAVDNDDRVDGVANLNGEQVLAGYDWSAGSHLVAESDPIDQRYTVSTSVLTNVPNATPDETIIIDMDGWSRCTVQVEKTGGTDTFIWTMLSSIESAEITADYIDTTQYGFTSMTVVSAATYTVDGILSSNPDFVPRAHKVKITTAGAGNDADFQVFVKKIY